MIHPIANMLKKDVIFIWSEQADDSFQAVKGIITSSPTLKPFRADLQMIVTPDASDLGASGILSQICPNGSEHPIAFWSRTFTDTGRRYSISEPEALSAVQAVER